MQSRSSLRSSIFSDTMEKPFNRLKTFREATKSQHGIDQLNATGRMMNTLIKQNYCFIGGEIKCYKCGDRFMQEGCRCTGKVV